MPGSHPHRRGIGASSPVRTDNFVFRLHYQATVVLLLTAAFLFRLHGQNAISCSASSERVVPDDVLNDHCLHRHQFSVPPPPRYAEPDETSQRPYPPMPPYYLSLWPLLLCLALTFYAPHWLWNNYENGRMGRLVQRLTRDSTPSAYRQHRIRDPWYGQVYYACETLNFVVAVGQLFVVDSVLGGSGQFLSYGTAWWRQLGSSDLNTNPERTLFPLQVACSYRLSNAHGSSNVEEVCVLPQNALHSKIYLCLWFWLVFLICCDSLMVAYRLVVFLCPLAVRRRLLVNVAAGARWGLVGVCFDRLLMTYHDEDDVEKCLSSGGGGGDGLRLNASDMCQLTFLLASVPWLELEAGGRADGPRDAEGVDDDVGDLSKNRGDVKMTLMSRGEQESPVM